MQLIPVRTLFHIIGIALSAAAPIAGAQVTINLTTTQQTNCTVTTDANGLVLAEGGVSLNAAGVTLSGTGCGGGSGGPPQPQGFALNVPANVTTTTPFQVSWAVTGATSCIGSASLSGSPITLAGWSGPISATSPATVTTPQNGTYTLTLICSNSQGTAMSTPATTTSGSSGGGVCPAGRQTTANVCYDAMFSSCVANDDITQFTTIWGRTSATGTIIPFPGAGTPVFFRNFDKTQYMAAEVQVPATGLSPSLTGFFTHGGTLGGPNLTMAISPTCGDFSPSAQYCLHTNVNPESILVPWKLPTATGNYCVLTPGQAYYLNIKVTDPSQPNATCSGNSCVVSVISNVTP